MEERNIEIINKSFETINGKEGTSSHLVTVPPGYHLSDPSCLPPTFRMKTSPEEGDLNSDSTPMTIQNWLWLSG